MNDYSSLNGFMFLAVLLVLYLIPSVIAYRRWHRNFKPIFALNIFLGWTFLGWLVCLVWSLSSNTQPKKVAENETQNIAKKFFLVSAETKERIQGFYTDEGLLKFIDEKGFSVDKVNKNSEGGMDFLVILPD
ncbi:MULTISPECIES: superinfection immunity protein [Citrobacter]|uniref:Superinfection immunity protein n=1 Tax=Citrobacter pasteurii TaxID=1563222 RepID=A0A6N6K0Q5_9ENTR|nr:MULTISPECIES: superinfection immunity protein [Citrobacter]KAA1275163.1 superinfection immunity protein [Citrobacter pasteurii]MBA4713065.1 superinfection immunity protein [Citrobacter pasteurii]MBA7942250.1 superinfection immunity protein [Citrobacter sp. RHBSTW-00271]MBD0801223.1 superinfection immunity protein [Citrobacter sp. C6_1]MBD0810213.1 superinfection immunity protein [Citrobacter sp. C6_2]